MPHHEVTPALRCARCSPPNASTASGDRGGAGGGVGHVGLHEATPELVGDRLAAGDVDVREDDVGSCAGQMSGHAFTDPVAPASDEGDLALDVDAMHRMRRGARSLSRGAGRGGAWRARREGAGSAGSWRRRAAGDPGRLAGDGRRLDHDDGVELQPFGCGGADNGDGPAHGVALEEPDLGASRRPTGHRSAPGPSGAMTATSACSSARPAASASEGREPAPSGGRTRGSPSAGPDDRGGRGHAWRGQGQQPRRRSRAPGPARGTRVSARRDAVRPASGRCTRTSSQSA